MEVYRGCLNDYIFNCYAMNETIFMRQDNKVAAAADSQKKESTGKEQKALSEKDAKIIRKFLEGVGPYEADALRIVIAFADGKVTTTSLPGDDQLALNLYLNSGLAKEQSAPQQIQAHRIHRASNLSKRAVDYCGKMQLLTAYEALMDTAVHPAYVEQARAGLDKMAASKTGQQTAGFGV